MAPVILRTPPKSQGCSCMSCYSLIPSTMHTYTEPPKHLAVCVPAPTATMKPHFHYFLIHLTYAAFWQWQYCSRADRTRLGFVTSGSSEEPSVFICQKRTPRFSGMSKALRVIWATVSGTVCYRSLTHYLWLNLLKESRGGYIRSTQTF